jgi:hypothetical protein
MFLRPRRSTPAALEQGALPEEEVFLGILVARLLASELGRVLVLEEGADFLAEGDLFGRELDVHGWLRLL